MSFRKTHEEIFHWTGVEQSTYVSRGKAFLENFWSIILLAQVFLDC